MEILVKGRQNGGRGLASIEDCVDAIIPEQEEKRKND